MSAEHCNILIDELPSSVSIDSKEYPISTNFRTFILFEILLSDKDLSQQEKLQEVVNLIFLDDKPPHISESVIDAIIDFYKCGKSETRKQKAVKKRMQTSQKAVYDFEWDDAYIYSAFLTVYGIDLNEIDELHWWKFRAMFDGLPSDCEFVKIMGYRSMDITKIKDNKERARIQKLQALYSLPDNLTVEEKALKYGAVLGGGMR